MKPKKTSEVPKGTDYVYEIKYDGGSAVIKIQKGKVEIQHGDNPDAQAYKYPELVKELKDSVDGTYIAELCVIDDQHMGGHFPYFLRRQCQEFFKIQTRSKAYPITAQIHDVIETEFGVEVYKTLLERKAIINKNIKETNHVKIVRFYETADPVMALKGKIEGCVTKRKDSQYRMDSRDGWWKTRFNKRKIVTFVKYEEWHKGDEEPEYELDGTLVDPSIITGIVLITGDGKRATLAGPRQHEAKKKIDTNGKVDILLEFHEETEEGFRFPVVVEIL
jgi:bifunctional non-homologous end joining protein LigD